MNRLVTIRSKTVVHPYLSHSKTASRSLRKFTTVKNVPRGSHPISAPYGRGYGLPMMRGDQILSLQTHRVPLGTVSQQFMDSRHFAEIRAEKSNKLLEDLSRIVDDEIKNIGEFEEESIYAELGKEYLSNSGLKLMETSEKDRINLVGSKGNATIKVSFNREPDFFGEEEREGQEQEQEEEEYEDVEDEEYEDEDDEGGEYETPEDQVREHRQNVEIEISYAGKDGKPKGQLLVSAIAERDNRIYIDSMAVKKGREDAQPRMSFSDLSDEMQAHIYKYLEQFQLNDDLARFVKQQIARERSSEDIEFLKEFKSLIV